MRELSRLLGLTPGEMTVEIEPVFKDRPMNWIGADIALAPGLIVGVQHTITFPTREGPTFTGRVRFEVFDEAQISSNSITISGEAEIVMRFPAWNNRVHVPMGLVRRIPDVVAARPGFVRASELPPPRYAHPTDAAPI